MHYVMTEYDIVDLKGVSTRKWAEKMGIRIKNSK